MDTVLRPLEHKKISEIPPALKDSLNRLQRYSFSIKHLLHDKIYYAHSNLDGIYIDVEQKLKLGRFNQAFNYEEHTAIVKSMDVQITQFLELYSVCAA